MTEMYIPGPIDAVIIALPLAPAAIFATYAATGKQRGPWFAIAFAGTAFIGIAISAFLWWYAALMDSWPIQD